MNKIYLILCAVMVMNCTVCTKERTVSLKPVTIAGTVKRVGNSPFSEVVIIGKTGEIYYVHPSLVKKYTIRSGMDVQVKGMYKKIVLETVDKKIQHKRSMITEIDSLKVVSRK